MDERDKWFKGEPLEVAMFDRVLTPKERALLTAMPPTLRGWHFRLYLLRRWFMRLIRRW